MKEIYSNCNAFIIDTDQYAGNFEREMCAHVTGHIGECEVGKEMVEYGIVEKFPNIIDIPDDNGCYRPVECYPLADNSANNAVVIFFDKYAPPTEEQINLMKERAGSFLETYRKIDQWTAKAIINITGFRLINFTTTKSIII